MSKHEDLLKNKFPHSKEDLLYNTGGNVMWSLFRTQSDGVNIYYHDTDEFHIINGATAKHYSLSEIADNWDPTSEELLQ